MRKGELGFERKLFGFKLWSDHFMAEDAGREPDTFGNVPVPILTLGSVPGHELE